MNNSLWIQNNEQNKIRKLNQDIETDVLIIGGGITGLTTAYKLINSGLKIALVEQNKVGSEISSKTTGKINYL